jgi:protein SCO1/2
LASFKGAPFVVALIYTSCQAVCPLILSDMLEIERRLSPAAQRTRFVAISLDPKRDTPGTLLAYAKQRKLDLSRWTLLTGDEDDVREIAAVLGMRYRQVAGGDFVHSSLITVVDGEGVIRRQQIGLRQDPAESVRVITQLVTP